MVLGFFSVHWSLFCRDGIWAVRVICWSLLILTLENLLENNQKMCQPVGCQAMDSLQLAMVGVFTLCKLSSAASCGFPPRRAGG